MSINTATGDRVEGIVAVACFDESSGSESAEGGEGEDLAVVEETGDSDFGASFGADSAKRVKVAGEGRRLLWGVGGVVDEMDGAELSAIGVLDGGEFVELLGFGIVVAADEQGLAGEFGEPVVEVFHEGCC